MFIEFYIISFAYFFKYYNNVTKIITIQCFVEYCRNIIIQLYRLLLSHRDAKVELRIRSPKTILFDSPLRSETGNFIDSFAFPIKRGSRIQLNPGVSH